MRATTLLLYAVVLVAETVWAAMIPLAPLYKDDLHLSGTQIGILVGSASVVILVTSVPAGILVDRLGAGWPTVAAALAVALSCVGQGYGRSYLVLLASRAVFGLGMSIVWTSAVIWLTEIVPPARRAGAVAFTVSLAGIAGVVGPGFAGLLSGSGVGTPFLVLGILSAAIAVALAPVARGHGGGAKSQPLLDTLRRLRGSTIAIAGLTLMGAGGLTMNALNLLIPLSLHAEGVSAETVGVAFSVAACAFFGVSLLLSRIGERAATLRLTSLAVLGFGVLAIVPVVSEHPYALYAFLLARGPFSAIIFTCAFPLTLIGAARVGVPGGAVLGLANAIWALATFAGPAGGGVLADHGGRRVGYVTIAVVALAVGLLLVRAEQRTRGKVEREAAAAAVR